MSELAQIATLVGSIAAGLGTVLGILLTKGVDGWIRLRKTRAGEIMEERQYEDGESAKAYGKLIGQFESRIAALEAEQKTLIAELKETRAEHVKCMIEHAALRGKFEALQSHVDRLWKHDEANKQNVDSLKAQVDRNTELIAK